MTEIEKNNSPKEIQVSEAEEQANALLEQGTPPEIVEQIKDAPPQIRKKIHEMLTFQASGTVGPPIHPLLNKFTTEHIDKFLDYTHKDNENEYKL